MTSTLANVIQSLLRGLGLRTINHQFFFSYSLIFLCAALTAAVLFMSAKDASQIDMAGAQRMLSQKMMKEALLAAQGVGDKTAVDKTIQRFEQSHRLLLNGDRAQGIAPVELTNAQPHLQRVDQIWQRYRPAVQALAAGQSADVNAIATDSNDILAASNEVVLLISAEANRSASQQLWVALGSTLCILLMVVLGRVAGMNWLMLQIDELRGRLERVSQGDFSAPLQVRHADDEMGMITLAYNRLLGQVGEMIRGVRLAADEADGQCVRMANLAGDSARNVEGQQAEIDQVATAMNEMLATSQEVARSTVEAANAADVAEQETNSGSAVMNESVGAIRTLSGHVDSLSDVMQQLVQDSHEIGKVLNVISGIAEQRQPAGAECGHRGGACWRAGPRFRGGCRRSPQPGQPHAELGQGGKRAGRAFAEPGHPRGYGHGCVASEQLGDAHPDRSGAACAGADRRRGADHPRHDQSDRHGGRGAVAGGRGHEPVADAHRPGRRSGCRGYPRHGGVGQYHHAEHERPQGTDRAFPSRGVIRSA